LRSEGRNCSRIASTWDSNIGNLAYAENCCDYSR
jgi:hypothetical protein